MMVEIIGGDKLDAKFLQEYFSGLVNRFFKILPMKENEEETLYIYMESLRVELIGCQNVVKEFNSNGDYMRLVSILQFLIDNPDYSVRKVRREVFNAISICNKLTAYFGSEAA